MYVLSFINQKGGVGKTTHAMNTAVRLRLSGARVLLVDMDPQCSLTYIAGVDRPAHTLMDVLLGRVSIQDAIIQAQECDLLASSPDLSLLEQQLKGPQKGLHLANALAQCHGRYDFVVIDSPPALGLLMLNALCASQSVVIPALADVFSLQGVGQLYTTIQAVKQGPNPNLAIEGILLTREVDASQLTRDVQTMLRATAQKMGTRVFDTYIRRSILVCEAQAARQSIFGYAPDCGQASDYGRFTLEYLKQLRLRVIDGK